MRVGVFSLINWSFLDQRPQVVAKKLAEWGHDVYYIEPFTAFKYWDDVSPHPWPTYESACWVPEQITARLSRVIMLTVLPHKRFAGILNKNQEYHDRNIAYIKELKLDFAVVIDPQYAEWCVQAGVPYIYDHVDDTHHMYHVIKNVFWEAQLYAEKNSVLNMYIQPSIAQRYNGLYVPNGFNPSDFTIDSTATKKFDSGALSCIADWFDMPSVLSSKKDILIIGPMEDGEKKMYKDYRAQGGEKTTWLPRMSRRMGGLWLQQCHTGVVPFRQDHKVIDYVMPLKIVEYFYLGLPAVSYVNKCIKDEFGDQAVSFYSPTGWLGYPSLDSAIERASNCPMTAQQLHNMALQFTWDNVFKPFKNYIELFAEKIAKSKTTTGLREESLRHIRDNKVRLVSTGELLQ